MQKQKIAFAVLAFAVLMVGIVGFAEVDKQAKKASIVENTQRVVKIDEDFLRSAVLEKKSADLLKIGAIEGGREFIATLDTLTKMFAFETEKTPNGIILSFSGVSTGDALHPYYGFFATENEKVTKIFWSTGAFGSLVSAENREVQVKNTGVIPWNTKDKWENYGDFSPITLRSVNGEDYIAPGAIGIFTLTTESPNFAPQNLAHEYIVEMSQ